MNKTKCSECLYYWEKDDEEFPRCHYESMGSWDKSPCEYEDDDYPEEDYSM